VVVWDFFHHQKWIPENGQSEPPEDALRAVPFWLSPSSWHLGFNVVWWTWGKGNMVELGGFLKRYPENFKMLETMICYKSKVCFS